MVSTAAKNLGTVFLLLFLAPMTQHWRIAGLTTQVVGLLAVGWDEFLVTCVAARGSIKLRELRGGRSIAVMCLNWILLLLVSVAILLLNGGHFARN